MKKFVVMALIAQILFNHSVWAQEPKKESDSRKNFLAYDTIMGRKSKIVKKEEKKETPPVNLLAGRTMIWGETPDPEQVKRDKIYDEQTKKIEEAKEKKLRDDGAKAARLAEKKLIPKVIIDSLRILAEKVAKLQSEIREGLSSTNLRIQSERSASERRNIEFKDSLNHLLAQSIKKIDSMMDLLKSGSANVSSNEKGLAGKDGKDGKDGRDGVDGKPTVHQIVTLQVPVKAEKHQTTILNSSKEQLGDALVEKLKNDPAVLSQIIKTINNEATKTGQPVISSNGSGIKVGEDGKLTDVQLHKILNQIKDTLVKQGLIGMILHPTDEQLIKALETRAAKNPALALTMANVGSNGSSKNDLSPSAKVRENEYLTNKQIKQMTDSLIKKNLIAAIIKDSEDRIKQATNDSIINAKVAKAVAAILKSQGGQSGKNGVDGKNGIDGKNGKDGIAGQNGVNGKDGQNGQAGQNGYGSNSQNQNGQNNQNGNGTNSQNQNDLANQNRNIGPGFDHPTPNNTTTITITINNNYNGRNERPQIEVEEHPQSGYSVRSGMSQNYIPPLNCDRNYGYGRIRR